MENYLYREFNRAVYRETLANGLRVELMPMTGFNKTYAIMTTDFGSIDNHFIPYQGDEPVWVPDGTAHFLEHKLFEKRDYDAFDLFGELGADSNAFTSFTQTSYLFSTTSHLHENLDVLLDFVQEPYFTEQMVAKEQGIIGQEFKCTMTTRAGASIWECWVTSIRTTRCGLILPAPWSQSVKLRRPR